MARYQLAVVDLDAVNADPTIAAAFAAPGVVVVRRTAHPEQLLAITDRLQSEDAGISGVELTLRLGHLFLSNPNALRADVEHGGEIWNYHLRRTGIRHEVAKLEGITWLRAQPDKAPGVVPAGAKAPVLGAEA